MSTVDDAFWHDKWKTGELGFHQPECHFALQKYWPRLNLDPTSTVFVPLCGKSKDMVYLRQQGHNIFGVELSQTAIVDFARGNTLTLGTTTHNSFTRHHGHGYDLWVGDFFKLSKDSFAHVAAVYDRASLIALPPNLRRKYVDHLQGLLSKDTLIFLIALCYDQDKMDGPPFSVSETIIDDLFGQWCTIEKLEQAKPEDFRGIQATESFYRLTVNE